MDTNPTDRDPWGDWPATGDNVRLFKPVLGYEAGDSTSYWYGTGGWVSVVRRTMNDTDEAFSIILSRVTLELVEAYGIEAAQRILRSFANYAPLTGPTRLERETDGEIA